MDSQPQRARRMSKNRIVVLISLWKSGQYLKTKLQDILQQTYFNQSAIVLLNCQNIDNESEIYSNFLQNKNIITIQYSSHVNLYKAWNDGIKITQSEYIMNSNVDDTLHPQYIEKCIKWLDTNTTYACVSTGVLITNTPNQLYPNWQYNGQMPLHAYPLSTAGPCPVWRRSLHDKYGYFGDYRVIGDARMWEKWYAGGEKFGLINDSMVLYYAHSDSLERRTDQNGNSLRNLDITESSSWLEDKK